MIQPHELKLALPMTIANGVVFFGTPFEPEREFYPTMDKIFDISFEADGKRYAGWVNPSDKTDQTGKPVSFHVVLDGVSFGYLSLNNCKWTINEERPSSLIEAIGHEIEKRYEL